MGLRLYQAPVESGCPSKPAADKSAAQARSAIRRNALRRDPEAVREQRRRRVTTINSRNALNPSDWLPPLSGAAESHDPDNEPDWLPSLYSSITPNEADADLARAENATTATDEGDTNGPHFSRVANSVGSIDDRVIAMFGERLARARQTSSPRDENSTEVSGRLAGVVTPHVEAPVPPEPLHTESNVRTTSAHRRPSPHARVDDGSTSRNLSPAAASYRGSALRPRNARRASWRRRRSGSMRATAAQPSSLEVDGLGDRNRSLSADAEDVWDTLLSSITPDPQPPSMGTSFASTTASGTASSAGPADSSGTSLSAPGHGENAPAPAEPPCESGCDNSDTDDDEEEVEQQNALARFPSSLRRYRSYADATRSTSEDTSVEFLDGMQRIVRNLAHRQDIPDEWWAEAGLSRTLSRETSTT